MAQESDQILASMASAKLGDQRMAQPPKKEPEGGETQAHENGESASMERTEDANEGQTENERVQSALSPNDEAAQMNQQAATFKVKINDIERELNPNQIASTFERYASLNHAHQTEVAPMRPVLALAKAIQAEAAKNGANIGGEEIAQLMAAATKAMIHNPQMGQQVAQEHPVDQWETELGQWENENAVSLPPKYKDAMRQMTGMQDQMNKMQEILAQVAGKAHEVGTNAKNELNNARDAQISAIKATIGTNLARAQQQFGMPDEAENDFMQFAMARGYTLEDFIDPRLTATVVQDFKNNMNSPEMERLRALAAKRQAFTGSMPGAPSGGMGMTRGQNADNAFFNSMVDQAVSSRFK